MSKKNIDRKDKKIVEDYREVANMTDSKLSSTKSVILVFNPTDHQLISKNVKTVPYLH